MNVSKITPYAMKSKLKAADLFCGAGGTSTGLIEACEDLGYKVELTAINHWNIAVATHTANHPLARHLCASLDALNPRDLYKPGELDILVASPECTNHTNARTIKKIIDQSRATAWCVVRWADALKPKRIIVENVKGFLKWGPLIDGERDKEKLGQIFYSWVGNLRALGYRVEWRLLIAADYGDPTTRERLIIQAALGNRKIVWPEPTHCETGETDLFGPRPRWKSACNDVIDWSIPGRSIFGRKKSLRPRTMDKIYEGLVQFAGNPFMVCMEHGGRIVGGNRPVPTITTAKGGAIGIVKPSPFLVEYYGNSSFRRIDRPLGAVTTRDRYGLVIPKIKGKKCDVEFRMFTAREYARTQGFPDSYNFTGTNSEVIKQIGNAVPKNLAKAIVKAVLTQNKQPI